MKEKTKLEKGKSYILKYRDYRYSYITTIYIYRLLESGMKGTKGMKMIKMNTYENYLSVRTYEILNESLDYFVAEEVNEDELFKNLEGKVITKFSEIIEYHLRNLEKTFEVYRVIGKSLDSYYNYISTFCPDSYIRVFHSVDGFDIQSLSIHLLSPSRFLIGTMDKEEVEIKFTETLLEELKTLYM